MNPMPRPAWLQAVQREKMRERQSAKKRASAEGSAIADMIRAQREAKARGQASAAGGLRENLRAADFPLDVRLVFARMSG
jgi:hypothetical protein